MLKKTSLAGDVASFGAVAPDGIPAEHFRSVVERSGDAIICKTVGGLITSWNPGAQTIFDYTADEMLGQPMLRLIPPENHHEEESILKKNPGRGKSGPL